MLGFDVGRPEKPSPTLAAGPLVLRAPRVEDYAAWRLLRESGRAHLTRWEPDWTPDDVTLAAYRRRVRTYDRERRTGGAHAFFMVRRDDETLVGGVTLSGVRYQSSCSASLGYWVGERHARLGYGHAGVQAVVAFAFRTLGLNRVEAACQPDNEASARLLAKAGFREEGFARDYLFINGAWRDHRLFAITARDAINRAANPGEARSRN